MVVDILLILGFIAACYALPIWALWMWNNES